MIVNKRFLGKEDNQSTISALTDELRLKESQKSMIRCRSLGEARKNRNLSNQKLLQSKKIFDQISIQKIMNCDDRVNEISDELSKIALQRFSITTKQQQNQNSISGDSVSKSHVKQVAKNLQKEVDQSIKYKLQGVFENRQKFQ